MSETVVSKGGKATFSFEVKDASYKGKWFLNGLQLLHDGSRIVISQSGGKHTLVINHTKKTDEGKVVFKAIRGNLEVPFKLTVKEPPTINAEEFQKCSQAFRDLKTGLPMVLRIPFTGAHGAKATWRFNGTLISTTSRRKILTTRRDTTLTVESFQVEDCGKYEVTLENAHGKTVLPITLSLSDKPTVDLKKVPGTDKTAETTSTMTIKSKTGVGAPAKPVGSIKFDNVSSNNFFLDFVTTSRGDNVDKYIVEKFTTNAGWEQCARLKLGERKIKIEGLEVEKSYIFRIKAVNVNGESEGLESSMVTVQKPSYPPILDPVVVGHLKEVYCLNPGKDFRLKIPYTGFPRPEERWTKHGKELIREERITMETTDVDTSLTILGLTSRDSGQYSLFLKNKEGRAHITFKIVVIGAPSEPVGPFEVTDVSSSSITLSWKPPITDGGSNVTGYSVDQQDQESPLWTEIAKVGPEVSSFTATGLTKGRKYCYRIKARNAEGESKPLISAPIIASGVPGPPVELVAKSTSSTHVTLTWKKPEDDGGSPVSFYSVEMRKTKEEWKAVPNIQIKKLSADFDNLTPESQYEFRVSAKNAAGIGPWTVTKLPVVTMDASEPPVISTSFQQTSAKAISYKAGETVSIKVPVSGIPTPTATWSHNGKALALGSRVTSKSEKGIAELKIQQAKRADAGKYEVLVENSAGTATTSLKINVKDVPAIPGGQLKAMMVSSKGITVGWAPPDDDGGSKITQYIVEKQVCGEDNDEWIMLSKVLPGEELKTTTDDVVKGKIYKFRVYASNSVGNSPPLTSTEIVAKFKIPAACNAPKVSDVTKSSCVLTWKEPDDGGCPITGYLVEMKPKGQKEWIAQYSGKLVAERNLKIKDLCQDNEYQFRITANNEEGISPPGKESDMITIRDPRPPPPPATELMVVDKTDSTVSLCWTSPSDLSPHLFSGFFVERCHEGTEIWEKCNKSPIRAPKYTVTGLKKGEKYQFRVRPYNEAGFGSACFVDGYTEVRKTEEKPSISFDSSFPQTIEVQASGTLRLVASVTGKPTPSVRWEKDGVDIRERGEVTTRGRVTELVIKKLSKSDAGNYVLHAENPSGNIYKAVKVIVKAAPNPPCNIKLGEIKEDGSLLISWDPPKDADNIKYYCLQQRDAYSSDFQTVKGKIANTEYTVRNLKPGCVYYFRVITEDELGRGAGNESNLLTVVQKRGPREIEMSTSYGARNINKSANFNVALKPVQVKVKAKAIMKCGATGTPDPEITWYKDGQRIEENNKFSMKKHNGECILIVADCQAGDSGMYKCEAVNSSGKAQSEASLTVEDS